tara:strand:- start:393 stop:896 length:504 start_codon:yes stop_codon:yes gene_type:complete
MSLKTIDARNLKLKNFKNYILSLIIVASIFLLDRISKIKVINIQSDNNKSFINDFINIDLIWNTGIGFGLLSSDNSTIYNFITIIIGLVIIFLIYLIVKSNNIEKLFFSLVLGGALGNFYDRCTYFAVPDFIDIHYKNFHWFTFNIADIFITVGIVLLISKDLIFKK